MHKSWQRRVAEECLQKVHIVLLPPMEPINTNKMLSCRRMRLLLWKTEFVTSFILRELNFHTNSQCSRLCKGRLNTVHHPWFPWRPWSPYDNRIPTIAVKTLIPARSKQIITRKPRRGIRLFGDKHAAWRNALYLSQPAGPDLGGSIHNYSSGVDHKATVWQGNDRGLIRSSAWTTRFVSNSCTCKKDSVIDSSAFHFSKWRMWKDMKHICCMLCVDSMYSTTYPITKTRWSRTSTPGGATRTILT